MDMDMMFREDEMILHRFRLTLPTVIRKGLINKALVVMVCGMLVMIPCLAAFFEIGLGPEYNAIPVILLWPIWAYLIYSARQLCLYASTEYCVTTRGVYQKIRKKKPVKFVPYTQMYEIRSASEKMDTGDVVCILKPHKGLNKEQDFVLGSIPDYQTVKADMQQQLARCLAEQNQQALEEKLTETSEEMRAAIRDMLPDETLAALQTELFGANPESQGAFSDPTVNSLPEWPEEQPLQREE